MTGRIVMSSYESMRAAGTSVVCLSPVSILRSTKVIDAIVDISGEIHPLFSCHAFDFEIWRSILLLPPLSVVLRRLDHRLGADGLNQGGMGAVAAPVMGPVADLAVGSFGESIIVELGIHAGFDLTAKAADDLVFDTPIKKLIPIHSKRLETTGIKELTITLQFKQTVVDAALGFYRSSFHKYRIFFFVDTIQTLT
jgi:hypothetical protein